MGIVDIPNAKAELQNLEPPVCIANQKLNLKTITEKYKMLVINCSRLRLAGRFQTKNG